jgi:hypothetical protein
MNLGMCFFNPSLRTRLSTQGTCFNLEHGVNNGWTLQFEDGDDESRLQEQEAAEVGISIVILSLSGFSGQGEETVLAELRYGRIFKICYRSCCNMVLPVTVTCRRDYHGRVQNGS